MIDDAILGRSELYVKMLTDVMLAITVTSAPPPAKAREEILAQWVAANALLQLATVLAVRSGLTEKDLEIYEPALENLIAKVAPR